MKSSYLIAAFITLVTIGWVASGVFSTEEDPSVVEAALRPPMAVEHEASVPQVRVRRMTAETRVNSLIVLGETQASRIVEVKAETGGRVVETGAEEGATVEAGTLLVRLATDDRAQRLSRAEAAVARWEDRYSADQGLASSDYVSRQRVLESKAALEDARANLAAIQLDIDRTTVTAPFSGILADRLAEEGDYLSISDPVARIVDLDPLEVVANVTESDIGRLTLGQPGSATLVTGREISGTVSYIAPVADGVTRTFAVKVSFSNPSGAVPEGMTAEVRLPLESTRAHHISPALLALDDEGRMGVKLVDEDNRVVFHPVVVGRDGASADGLWVEGLPDPATLIIVGQEFVRAGQRVEPVDTETIKANTQALAAADRAALEAGRAPAATIRSVLAPREGAEQ
ncbi:efflux RND transporter periplasmic adaptor subunit [Rhodospira trueperi]|uniref:Membrane fusion protein, multidrug efflux system n=1 Tax=Rhodospira trueperi TaxID=69960 RepID=A0A1G7DJC8_9PROT|nr:efflux RND transporter periplasmic adaptor subunit [Rhodospira trueperi]SDE50855.1 membrane fusion protein, multidrug efflux system [Rhodospira trueperi]